MSRAGADRRARSPALAVGCGAAGGRVGARVSDQDGAGGERRARRSAPERAADLRRGGRAAVRDHLGHRRRRDSRQTTGPVQPLAGEPGHARRAAAAAPAGGLVSDLLARDLGRRAPGAGRVHLRGRAEPRAGAAVPGAEHRPATATTPRLLIARWVMFLSVMSAIGLFVLRMLIARPLVRRAPRHEPARGLGRVRDRVGARADRDPGVSRLRDRERFAALGVRSRGARAAVPRDRVRARATSISSSASRCSAWRRGLAVARPARPRAPLARRADRDRRRAARRRGGADRAGRRRARGADLAARV